MPETTMSDSRLSLSQSQESATPKEYEREVMDPVTHLPVAIHDYTAWELERVPPHGPQDDAPPSPGDEAVSNKDQQQKRERREKQQAGMVHVLAEEAHRERWRRPDDLESKVKVRSTFVAVCTTGIGSVSGLLLLSVWRRILGYSKTSWVELLFAMFGCLCLALSVGASVLFLGSSGNVPEEAVSEQSTSAEETEHFRKRKELLEDDEYPESAVWLNSVLHSLWPIVNPSLFASIADLLEDSLQASLPKLVRAVRVADVDQGTEPLRILGIRWLEPAAVTGDENDFVNIEVAVAYRARQTRSHRLRDRSHSAHVLLEFWLVGVLGVSVPVWVEFTGLLATARVRLQLSSDPPFLSFLTLTLLGQPKATLGCTPLAMGLANVMDMPVLSDWVQRSVDAVLARCVAPMSLTLDLKTLLTGGEKTDTEALGVVIVTVRSAWDFRVAKGGSAGGGDTYVTVGWSKWGKPLWSTRTIQGDDHPVWEETKAFLVGSAEINADEQLRLQLWDSDRVTGDNLLGIVDVPLKDVMSHPECPNGICTREDNLIRCDRPETLGVLKWECGYYPKTATEQRPEQKYQDTGQIGHGIETRAEDKQLEAKAAGKDLGEMDRQKQEHPKDRHDELVVGCEPTEAWPSGILSINIQSITDLEIQRVQSRELEEEKEDEESEELPSAYCTIIINHIRAYKTRTKRKNNKPFFNATTEKFLRDWRTSNVILSVRDSRIKEQDPVLGIVVLTLYEVFKHGSHVTTSLPLIGGIGHGRMHISLTFRSIRAQLPPRLLGWDVGTLEIQPLVRPTLDLPADLMSCQLVFSTLYGRGKMHAQFDGVWRRARDHHLCLPVCKRYASCLVIEFHKHAQAASAAERTLAYSTLWLKDIPDSQQVRVTLSVYQNDGRSLARARCNYVKGGGQRLGKIEVLMRFWPGLSGYHQNITDKDSNLEDVMAALDCAECKEATGHLFYEGESEQMVPESTSEDDSRSESIESAVSGKPLSGKRGSLDGIKHLGKKQGPSHRSHRGLLQWKAARNVAWFGKGIETQAEKVGHKIIGTFKHEGKESIDIEKEV